MNLNFGEGSLENTEYWKLNMDFKMEFRIESQDGILKIEWKL